MQREHFALTFFCIFSEVRTLRKEVAVLLSITKHPNIVRLIGLCDEPREYTLLLEFVDGKDLHDLLLEPHEEKIEEKIENWSNRQEIALQIAKGMDHLHSQNPPILHFDLKP